MLTPISKVLLLDGTRLKDVVLAIGSNRIEHNLKRPIEGWFITRKNAAADVYETDATSLTLSLTSSAAVTVDIWVY